MMSSQVLNQIIQQVKLLTEKEKNQLNQYLQTKVFIKKTPKKWKNICNLIPYSPSTENAQLFISNSRKESDKKREQQWQKR